VEETRLPAFMAMQKIADVVGPKNFPGYLAKLTNEQRKIYEGLSEESPINVLVGIIYISVSQPKLLRDPFFEEKKFPRPAIEDFYHLRARFILLSTKKSL